jgi:hypothetical protein
LKVIKDHNHALMVGEIKVIIGKVLGGKASEYVSCNKVDRQPIDSIISEARRRRKEEHSVEFFINMRKEYEGRITVELETVA